MIPEGVNWATILLSLLSSFIGAGAVIGGLLIAYGKFQGKITEKIQSHDERLAQSNGKIHKQQEKDSALSAKVQAISVKCGERYNLFVKNDQDHAELFRRVNSLETSVAAIPGKVNEGMDNKFAQWRKDLKEDMQAMLNTKFGKDK